jgi:hypothetical protein
MLQVLEDNFHPSSISNTFTTLLALFNATQGDKEGLHDFCSRFEGHVAALCQSLVAIPPFFRSCSSFVRYIPVTMTFSHNLVQNRRTWRALPSTLTWPTLGLWTNLLW